MLAYLPNLIDLYVVVQTTNIDLKAMRQCRYCHCFFANADDLGKHARGTHARIAAPIQRGWPWRPEGVARLIEWRNTHELADTGLV